MVGNGPAKTDPNRCYTSIGLPGIQVKKAQAQTQLHKTRKPLGETLAPFQFRYCFSLLVSLLFLRFNLRSRFKHQTDPNRCYTSIGLPGIQVKKAQAQDTTPQNKKTTW